MADDESTRYKPPFIKSSGDKPLGEPREILDVFVHNKIGYVKVKMARQYRYGNKPETHAAEYLPLVFDIGQFKRAYGALAEYTAIMEEMESKIQGLRECNAVEPVAAAPTWLYRLSAWLLPVFGCLPYTAENDAADCTQVERADSRGFSPDSWIKVESSHPKMPARSIYPPAGATAIVSTTLNSTCVPPAMGRAGTRAQSSFTITTSRNLGATEYTVLWIDSLETADGIGVRAQKMLIRSQHGLQLVTGDVSFDQLCSGREDNIKGIIGFTPYRLAWKLHLSKVLYQHPVYTGPPMEDLIPATICKEIQMR